MVLKRAVSVACILLPLCALGAEFLSVTFTTMPLPDSRDLPPLWLPWVDFSAGRTRDVAPIIFRGEMLVPWNLGHRLEAGCCDFLWRTGLSFTARDRTLYLGLTLRGIPFLCCGLSFDATILFTAPGRTIALSPRWGGGYGPVIELYGDLRRLEVYGWGLQFETGLLSVRELVALDPQRLAEVARITFYPGEREYWGLSYTIRPLTLTSEFWWGGGRIPFDLKRTRLSLVFPIYQGFQVVVEGEWDFSTEDPFDLLNIRWEVEF